MSFVNDQLLPGERLVLLVRPHPLVLLRMILLNIAAAALLLWLGYALDEYWLLLFYLVPLGFLIWEILVRHRCEYIVTDCRVVKQEGIFSVRSFDASLDKINNVFHSQSLLGRILNYGDVGLETASEQGTTSFHFIPAPVAFKNAVAAQRGLRKAMVQDPSMLRENIPRLLEELASLRDRNIITPEEFEAKKKALLDKI